MPLSDATSRWDSSHLRGPAITSLLAAGLERAFPREERWRPARATFELHGPVPLEPCWVEAQLLKRGRTLSLVDAEFFAGDSNRPLARARASFISDSLEATESDSDRVWSTPLPAECVPPPANLRSQSAGGRLYRSSNTEWSGSRRGHQNADRNLVWYFDEPIVEGESPSDFQRAARAADIGNYVINAGADGLAYINTDVTLHLSRLPAPGGIGVCSELRSADGAVSVGTAILFDSEGACGTSSVTAVRHTKTRMDYTSDRVGSATAVPAER